MDKEEFSQILQSATQELLTLTRAYMKDSLPDDCIYRHVSVRGAGWEAGPLIKADAVVDCFWREGEVPEHITLVAREKEKRQTIVHLIALGNYVNPDAEEWRTNWARVGLPVRRFLPFLLKLPVPQKDWRLLTDGMPDMSRSLRMNGKYELPKPPY